MHDGAEKYIRRFGAERDRGINYQYLYFCSVYFYYYYRAFSGDVFYSFFFKSLRLLFCHYFDFIACFLKQYLSTSGKTVMDLEAGLLLVGSAW